MSGRVDLRPHVVHREDRDDGAVILTSGYDLGPVAQSTSVWLRQWAGTAPDRTFLAERSGPDWRRVSYGEAWQQVQALAAGLLDLGLSRERPLLILSGNSVGHGLIMLAALHVGVPVVPVAEQYALIPEAWPRLRHVLDLVRPGAVYAEDADAYAGAIGVCDLPVIAAQVHQSGAMSLDRLAASQADISAAHARVGPDTLAKILMTSGSTSDPKGVETSQRMLTANQAQVAGGLPLLTQRPPVLVDWLPWNHVFGGSHNFNIALANGGTLYIDDGKPLPALFGRSVENLGMVSGTISFNVPVGFAQLVTALRQDAGLRRRYFADLDVIFYAGTSLAQEIWSALEDLARQELGQVPHIMTSWGLTETAPGCTQQHEPAKGAGIIGVPLPGVTVKLVPAGEDRWDIRVRGDNVFRAYHRQPDKTAEAFDDEGFFISGDVVRLVDAGDMTKGLAFEGRLSEEFKLSSGTWVRAAQVRLDLLATLAPFAADVVICGAARDEIGALIVPNRQAIAAAGFDLAEDGGVVFGDALLDAVRDRLGTAAAQATGSSTRVTRALILSDPPSMAAGELTAKGNINFARLMSLRAPLVERLFAGGPYVMTVGS